jgi:acyl-CoA-binding protein
LYAYAKVAQGQDFSAAKKPGMFDLTVRLPYLLGPLATQFRESTHGIGHTMSARAYLMWLVANHAQGKAKYNKWKEVVDAGTSQKEAEDKYIALGEELLAKHDK